MKKLINFEIEEALIEAFDKKIKGKLTRTEAFTTFVKMVNANALVLDVEYKIAKQPNPAGMA